MLMILGWIGTEYGPEMREFLPDILAGVCNESAVSACLAALPEKTDERAWLLALLSSLKQVTAVRTGALVRASTLSADNLVACDRSGLDDIIIVQDKHDPRNAINNVRVYERGRPSGTMSIRVWLDDMQEPFQSQVCAWKYGTGVVSSVELSPFRAQPASYGIAARTSLPQFSCEWLRSAVTISSRGAVLPCPAHLKERPPSVPARSMVDVLVLHAGLLTSAGSTQECRTCGRFARFAGAKDIEAPMDMRPAGLRIAPLSSSYRDYVGCDAGSLKSDERDIAVATLVQRIQANGEGQS